MKIKLPVLPGEECWIVSILNGVHHCKLLESYTVDLYNEGFDRLYTRLGPIAPEHCFASKEDADTVWMRFCILNKTMGDSVAFSNAVAEHRKFSKELEIPDPMPKGTVISWDYKGKTYTMSIDHGIYYNEDGLAKFVYRDKIMLVMEETVAETDIIPVDVKLPVAPGDEVYVSPQESPVIVSDLVSTSSEGNLAIGFEQDGVYYITDRFYKDKDLTERYSYRLQVLTNAGDVRRAKYVYATPKHPAYFMIDLIDENGNYQNIIKHQFSKGGLS